MQVLLVWLERLSVTDNALLRLPWFSWGSPVTPLDRAVSWVRSPLPSQWGHGYWSRPFPLDRRHWLRGGQPSPSRGGWWNGGGFYCDGEDLPRAVSLTHQCPRNQVSVFTALSDGTNYFPSPERAQFTRPSSSPLQSLSHSGARHLLATRMVRGVGPTQDFTPDFTQHTTLLPVTASLSLTRSLSGPMVLAEAVSSTLMDTTTCPSQSFSSEQSSGTTRTSWGGVLTSRPSRSTWRPGWPGPTDRLTTIWRDHKSGGRGAWDG